MELIYNKKGRPNIKQKTCKQLNAFFSNHATLFSRYDLRTPCHKVTSKKLLMAVSHKNTQILARCPVQKTLHHVQI